MTKLEPFDLERFNAGEKAVDVDGHEVCHIYDSKDSTILPFFYFVKVVADDDITLQGDWVPRDGGDMIFMAPKEKKTTTYWINIFKHDLLNGDQRIVPEGPYNTEKLARSLCRYYKSYGYIKTISGSKFEFRSPNSTYLLSTPTLT